MLIDIGRIPELSGIRRKGGKLEIGAGTVHHDVATSAMLQQDCPMLAEAAASIGDPQVRNRGTLGGSLAHADPSADYPAAMLALDADIHIRGSNGARVVKARDFFRGLFTVDLAADEIIVAVQFVPVKAAAYAKLYQRASHFAIVGVAAALGVKQRSGHVGTNRRDRRKLARHAPDGRGRCAHRANRLSASTIAAAVRSAGATLEDINSDIHASKEYRRAMIPIFTERALAAALERAT